MQKNSYLKKKITLSDEYPESGDLVGTCERTLPLWDPELGTAQDANLVGYHE